MHLSITQLREHIDGSKERLNTELARILPLVVAEAEEARPGTSLFQDVEKSDLLLLCARDSLAIGLTGTRPARFQVVCLQARAALTHKFQLFCNKGTSLFGHDVRIEVGLNVGGDNVDDTAERTGGLLENVERLRGRARSVVAGLLPGRFCGADEAGELLGGAVIVEDSFIADDSQNDNVPHAGLTPFRDFGDLGLSSADATRFNENADDHLDIVRLAGCANVLETRAVGSVEADGEETFASDYGNVCHDFVCGLALARRSVWCVAVCPFVAVGRKATVG